MFLKLLLAFTIIPIIELYLLISVGRVIGTVETIWLVIVTGMAGAALAKSQGLKLFLEINQALSAGRVPGQELVEGLIVMIGGITLLTPGLITDLFGLSMLLPFSRRFYARIIIRYFKGRIISNHKNGKLNAIDVEVL